MAELAQQGSDSGIEMLVAHEAHSGNPSTAYGFDVLAGQVWKSFEYLAGRTASIEVTLNGVDRYAGASKYGLTTECAATLLNPASQIFVAAGPFGNALSHRLQVQHLLKDQLVRT